ncbi:4'-phosphopantetheinyl transferase superfamily protein [Candidatus Bipolaricaulota bacterium]|nr:4'-phosphopantetheinyl transferase superfamily protein [Candidatus Bipolaricaulota bacterium]
MMGFAEGTLPPPNAVHVWRFSLVSARQEITAFRHWLSERENEAIERMVSLIERDKRIVAWGRLRYILSRYLAISPRDIGIRRVSTGRPEIVSPEETGLRFSLTHSGNHGLLAVSRMPVGIDLENIRPSVDADALSARFFARNESESIADLPADERVEAFFRVWVRKEAYLKAAGGSVPAGLSKCEVSADAADPRVLVTEFEAADSLSQLIDIPVHQGYLAALAVLGGNPDVRIYDL